MKEIIPDLDLTPIAKEWFIEQFEQFVQGNEKKVTHFNFDLRDFLRFVIRYVLDYQLMRQWGNITITTARMLGYEDRSIRKFRKRNP